MLIVDVAGSAPVVLPAGVVDNQAGRIKFLRYVVEIAIDWRPQRELALRPAFIVDAISDDGRMIAITCDQPLPGVEDLVPRLLRGIEARVADRAEAGKLC